jgi:hypothetical protein
LFNPYVNLINTNSLDGKRSTDLYQCDCPGQIINIVEDPPVNPTTNLAENTTSNPLNNCLTDDLLSNLNSKDLYMMQRLALEADFNGLRDLCNKLEPSSPQTIAVIAQMVEEFAYENLLSLIENFVQKSRSSRLDG